MAAQDPTKTTLGDLCLASLREAGVVGMGQAASRNDINETWTRCQWMLQQWERKRWLVYHLVDLAKVSTGALSYSVGPGGDFDTGPGSVRPARLESGFLRQIQTAPPNQVDFPLEIMKAREDYNRIALKSLVAFPAAAFLDTDWPLAHLFVWPVPNANIYEVHISVLAQLPASFLDIAVLISLPYEYYDAIVYNLALRNRPRYRIGTFPGDMLPVLARDSLNVLRGANTQIARLHMPAGVLARGSGYNIFSDRF